MSGAIGARLQRRPLILPAMGRPKYFAVSRAAHTLNNALRCSVLFGIKSKATPISLVVEFPRPNRR